MGVGALRFRSPGRGYFGCEDSELTFKVMQWERNISLGELKHKASARQRTQFQSIPSSA